MDKWTTQNEKIIINVLVNSSRGSIFLESYNARNSSTDGSKLYSLFRKTIDKIGKKNIVQVVTDNASENVSAGKMMEAMYPHIYWTPCGSHCINLMLVAYSRKTHMLQKNLRNLVLSNEWKDNSYAKEAAGKETAKIFISPSFWNDVVRALKVGGPLIRVLRMVDGEKKLSMGYLYEAMDRAKETI
ncbi:uncharacterized protein [Nicotiana tomentosiformis]|uniref:uncharacterized protein n=1 Tax=Nicotiana tomentosiformis TaxID=4098 RepID=UPI00388C79E3